MNFPFKSKEPNQLERERWHQVKARGLKSFILRFGVLYFGGLMFLVTTAMDLVWPRTIPIIYTHVILRNLLIWPWAGCVVALFMWHYNEHRFSEGDTPG